MPEAAQRVPPRLVISRPIEVVESKDRTTRRRRTRDQGRTSSSDWTDVEDSPPRRRRTSKRLSQRRENALGSSRGGRVSTSSLGRFIPNLGGIKELAESTTGSRPSTRGSEQARHNDRTSTRRNHHREHQSSRPPRHRTGGVQRRTEKGFKINPSLLSVISASTGVSDRSSGSTITQETYNRDRSKVSKKMDAVSSAKSPNVFDFMDDQSAVDIDDGRSVASSAPSSHYPQSECGSSAGPETPSSQSTFPSPTAGRRLSGSEIRAKYDKDYAASLSSGRSSSRSPDPSTLNVRHRPSIEDIPEHEEESNAPSIADLRDHRRRSSSRSSLRSSRRMSDHRLQHQEEAMRQHMAYLQHQQGHYVAPIYEPHRSHSASPINLDHSPPQQHMAMQHYQWHQQPPGGATHMSPPPPTEATNGHITTQQRPEAPAPPDLTQRTLTGYELMALELSQPSSSFQPIYRKFEYLNHRILLHLQDEICELEEQLRHLDELVARTIPESPDGTKTPSSRRGEAWGGNELHYRRTELLGRIFVKTEQYNRAMSSYASMARDAAPADDGIVDAYRVWVAKHKPVHEVETRFLQRAEDLVQPGKNPDRPAKTVVLAYVPVALVLPLLLFSIVPTLGGRLLVTLVIAGGAFLVAATTRIRLLMCAREWAVCGAAFVLLMAAIAGCIPHHGG